MIQSCVCVTFTQEADEPPDEVAAAVAEGGFGQGDPPQAVARCGALVPGPDTGGLLRPLLPAQGARCPAVRRVRVRRCGPAGVGHVLRSLPELRQTHREEGDNTGLGLGGLGYLLMQRRLEV